MIMRPGQIGFANSGGPPQQHRGLRTEAWRATPVHRSGGRVGRRATAKLQGDEPWRNLARGPSDWTFTPEFEQALVAFDFVGTQLAECDAEVELQLQRLQVHDGEPAKGKKRGRARNAPKFDLRTQLFRMCGVDLTRIDGVDVTTALAVVSEVGTDMSRIRRSIKHFTSWLGLCPGTNITGGKVKSGTCRLLMLSTSQKEASVMVVWGIARPVV